MIQIGNFHIGRYDTAQKPTLAAGEAYTLWDNLVSRYDWDDSLEIFYNYAHDLELRATIEKMITILSDQSAVIEKQLELFKLPLPPQPRKTINFDADSGIIKDEFIFRRLLSGMQDFLTICAEALRQCVINDNLREMFIGLLTKNWMSLITSVYLENKKAGYRFRH